MPALTLFALLCVLLTWAWDVPLAVFAAYALMSLVCLVVYARDKAAARQGRRRTRERTLHLLALLGGWPGALVAQTLLRHKSSKPRFRAVFWVTVLTNVALLVGLSSPQGGHWAWLR